MPFIHLSSITSSVTSDTTADSSIESGPADIEGAVNEIGGFFSGLWKSIVDFFTKQGISLAIRVLAALLVIVLGHFLIKLIDKLAIKLLKRRRAKKGKSIDGTMGNFVRSCFKFLFNLVLIFLVLSILNIPLDNLFSVLSAAVLAIGLALQDLLANFANGVVLLTSHHFKAGDYIQVAGYEGNVEEINMMTIVLITIDNKKVVIPNSNVAKDVITNYSSEITRRVTIDIGVAYGTDLALAFKCMVLCAKEDERVVPVPNPVAFLTSYKDSSINVSLRCWTKTENYWDVLFSLNQKVYDKFNEFGVEIAFPQMDIHFENKKKPVKTKKDYVKILDKQIAKIDEKRLLIPNSLVKFEAKPKMFMKKKAKEEIAQIEKQDKKIKIKNSKKLIKKTIEKKQANTTVLAKPPKTLKVVTPPVSPKKTNDKKIVKKEVKVTKEAKKVQKEVKPIVKKEEKKAPKVEPKKVVKPEVKKPEIKKEVKAPVTPSKKPTKVVTTNSKNNTKKK